MDTLLILNIVFTFLIGVRVGMVLHDLTDKL